jgi:hypothetical protein
MSLVDWDWEQGTSYRSLSAAKYVSPPTSLLMQVPGGSQVSCAVLCRRADTLCLPEGELRTWYQTYVTTYPFACFRNQAALGSANALNCYYFQIASNRIDLWRRVGGSASKINSFYYTFTGATWYHLRFVWWNGATESGTPALAVAVYIEVGSVWAQIGSVYYDTLNLWSTSEVNRVGLWPWIANNWYSYFDDTEIWGPSV